MPDGVRRAVGRRGVVAIAATAGPQTLSEANAARMKRSVLHAAVAARAPEPPARGSYGHAVPHDALLPFAPGISWAVTAAEGMTLVHWVFEPPECTSLPPEQHAQTQAGMVLAGTMVLHYGDGTAQTCRAGDVYAIAPNTTHGAEFLERTVLLDVYAPNRRDFETQYRVAREA